MTSVDDVFGYQIFTLRLCTYVHTANFSCFSSRRLQTIIINIDDICARALFFFEEKGWVQEHYLNALNKRRRRFPSIVSTAKIA